jgi:hypothetical protein
MRPPAGSAPGVANDRVESTIRVPGPRTYRPSAEPVGDCWNQPTTSIKTSMPVVDCSAISPASLGTVTMSLPTASPVPATAKLGDAGAGTPAVQTASVPTSSALIAVTLTATAAMPLAARSVVGSPAAPANDTMRAFPLTRGSPRSRLSKSRAGGSSRYDAAPGSITRGGSVVDVVVGPGGGGGGSVVVGSGTDASTAVLPGAEAVTAGAAARPVVQLANKAAATKKGRRRTKGG